ncbi:MAG: hypothetical protein V1672_03385 [Candidatus Diapherotrites archaeon]
MKLKNEKGFLGPLGDDLPSLIPLLFALVIFFSAFTSAFNTFDKKNSAFQAELEVSSIAAKLVADSYIEGYDGFQLLCKKVAASDVKYKAGIIELPLGIDDDVPTINPLNPEFYYFPTEDEKFECPEGGENPTENSRNLMVRVYPIALELKDDTKIKIASGFIVRPMILVVITWND